MTVSNLKHIFSELGYVKTGTDITKAFIDIPDIARIVLIHDGNLYRESHAVRRYYLDETHGFLIRAAYTPTGDELGVEAVISVSEIIGVETRNAYSVAPFAGYDY